MLTRLTAAVAALCLLAPAPADAAPSAAARLDASFRAAQRVSDGEGVTVAIVADGVSGSVSALKANLVPGRTFIRPPYGMPVTGTMMASIIHSLAPKARILPVRAKCGRAEEYDEYRYCPDQVANGIRWAAESGAQVIATPHYSHADRANELAAAVRYAGLRGAVVVAANLRSKVLYPRGTRRQKENDPVYPATLPGVIGVAVTTAGGAPVPDAAQTSASLVAAPGHRQTATGPDGRLWEFEGAAPAVSLVAAAAALIRAEQPRLAPDGVARTLAVSARHPQDGYDPSVGFGLLDPAAALAAAPAHTEPTTTPPEILPTAFGDGRPILIAVHHARSEVLPPAAMIIVGAALLMLAAVRRHFAP